MLIKALESYCALADIRGFDCENAVKEMKFGRHGKPYIPDFAHFSVSHSGNVWAVLIDPDDPCGLDIQLEKDVDIDAIAKKYFTERELEEVHMYGRHAFFHIWTRREAFIKAVGSTVFSEAPELIFPEYDCSMEVKYEGEVWQVREIEMPMKIYAAVCTKTFDQVKPYSLEFASRFIGED